MLTVVVAGFIKDNEGWGVLTLVLGLICGASAIPTFIFTGGTVTREALKWKNIKKRKDSEYSMQRTDGELC